MSKRMLIINWVAKLILALVGRCSFYTTDSRVKQILSDMLFYCGQKTTILFQPTCRCHTLTQINYFLIAERNGSVKLPSVSNCWSKLEIMPRINVHINVTIRNWTVGNIRHHCKYHHPQPNCIIVRPLWQHYTVNHRSVSIQAHR